MQTRLAIVCALSGLAGSTTLGACGDDEATCGPRPPPAAAARCDAPAPLLGPYDPCAPSMFVSFKAEVDFDAELARLSERYPLENVQVYRSTLPTTFSAWVSPETREALRCEATVSNVFYAVLAHGD